MSKKNVGGGSPIAKVGAALARTGTGTLRSKLDPGAQTEGEWLKGLPPAGTGTVEPETGELIEKKQGSREIPVALEDHILAEYSEGIPQAVLEAQYDLAKGYISRALTRRFGSAEGYRKALKNLLYENSIACAEHTLANVDKLHPSQSGMLVGTMTGAIIALEKHEREQPKALDFAELSRFADTLDRLEKFAGIVNEKELTGTEIVVEHLDSDAKAEVVATLQETAPPEEA